MSEEKTALFLCRPRRSGRLILQLNKLIASGVTKIVVEESHLKKQRDALLDACKAFQNRWKHSGPSGSAQWEKFDKVVNGIDAAVNLAEKEG